MSQNREKWTQSAECSKKNSHPPIYSQKRIGKQYVLYVHSMKEYNLRRHYVSLHADKYDNFQGQRRREKVNQLLAGLKNSRLCLLTAETSVTPSLTLIHAAVT